MGGSFPATGNKNGGGGLPGHFGPATTSIVEIMGISPFRHGNRPQDNSPFIKDDGSIIVP